MNRLDEVIVRKNRQTGTKIVVGSALSLGLDDEDGACSYYTICDDHFGMLAGHSTKKLALEHAAYPLGWCETCIAFDKVSKGIANEHDLKLIEIYEADKARYAAIA